MSTLIRMRRGALAAAAAAVLVITGCAPTGEAEGGPSDGGSPSATESAPGGSASGEAAPALVETEQSAAADLPRDPAQDPAYARFYEQSVQWGPCDDSHLTEVGVECGTAAVPVAWNAPEGETLDIALVRLPATSGEPQGALLVNPGGPGGSGVDFVGATGSYVGTAQLRASYDLIGFDPRGVSRSGGFRCLSDEERDASAAVFYDTTTPEGIQQLRDDSEEYTAACAEAGGALLGHLDTLSAARDLDVLRAALGQDALDYLGFSYGTYLGATYAELYPERVGRMVLDAALPTTITLDQLVAGQAEGFEGSVAAFLEHCLAQGETMCPFTGDVTSAKQQLRSFFETLDANPLPTSDPERELSGAQARTAVILLQYNDANWTVGLTALSQAMNGDGTGLLRLADLSAERQADGTYRGNAADANTAVNCLDHPWAADETWQQQEAERLAEDFPTFGEQLGYASIGCEAWPVPPQREPAPVTAAGSDLIVVIGTTGDPATPYEWSQSMARDLENSALITFDGNGHTAYGRSGGCVEDAVDAYFLEGTAPQDGLQC